MELLSAVPAHLGEVHVTRAWPHREPDRLVIEGRDPSGRLRAGYARRTAGGHGLGIRVLEPGVDPKLPALQRLSRGADLVVHRAGRRAVLFDGERYLKIVRGDIRELAATMERCAVLAAEAGFRAPHVRQREGALELSVVAGTPLQETTGSAWADGLRAWADRWAGFVGPGVVGPAVVGPAVVRSADPGEHAVHDAAAEQAVLARWVERTEGWHRLPADTLRPTLDRASRMLAAAPMPLGVAHRDLHDKQLITGAEPGLLDFDTAALAEPALDLANLAVHLDLRAAQGLLDESERRWGRGVVVAVARSLQVPEQRWHAYELATRLRLACVYAFRPRWQSLAEQWMRGLSSPAHGTITDAGWDG